MQLLIDIWPMIGGGDTEDTLIAYPFHEQHHVLPARRNIDAAAWPIYAER